MKMIVIRNRIQLLKTVQLLVHLVKYERVDYPSCKVFGVTPTVRVAKPHSSATGMRRCPP